MKRREKIATVYDLLFQQYGECHCPLAHASPFQLLCAVLLSAQCRDDRVNLVTPKLFRRYGTPETMAKAPIGEVRNIIASLGLAGSKAKHLVELSQMLLSSFHGAVPQTMEELTKLPGIGRKSANVVLGNAFHLPGFPVDTHVNRLTNRLGLVHCDDPVKIEAAITKELPPERWCNFSHLLIFYGREICRARNPECANCVLAELCPHAKKERVCKH